MLERSRVILMARSWQVLIWPITKMLQGLGKIFCDFAKMMTRSCRILAWSRQERIINILQYFSKILTCFIITTHSPVSPSYYNYLGGQALKLFSFKFINDTSEILSKWVNCKWVEMLVSVLMYHESWQRNDGWNIQYMYSRSKTKALSNVNNLIFNKVRVRH